MEIKRTWQASHGVYETRQVWHQMLPHAAPRRAPDGPSGLALCPKWQDRAYHAQRSEGAVPTGAGQAPVQGRSAQSVVGISDFTYVSTWQGWAYAAFVIDVFTRRIVGWRVSSTMNTDFVLDTLERALYARQGEREGE